MDSGIYLGDNLEIMQGIPEDSIDLIATDPPFCTGRDFGEYDDRWSGIFETRDELSDTVVNTAKKVYGGDMGAFLCFIAVRLLEMRRILKPTGSIYLHCDATASHYIKQLMDAIFGKENFRNEIVWCYTGPQRASKHFPRKHDLIFFYGMGDDTTFNKDLIRVESKWNGLGGFDKSKQKLQNKGKVPEDRWHITFGPNSKERTGYPTQKPVALYERIILASSNPGDVVLDPFCGSGATLVAAKINGRGYVGIDQNKNAIKICNERLGENKT